MKNNAPYELRDTDHFDLNDFKTLINNLYTRYTVTQRPLITMNTPVSEVRISDGFDSTEHRIQKSLYQAEIYTIGDLTKRFNKGNFHTIRGFGRGSVSLRDVEKFIQSHHLESPKTPEDITELYYRIARERIALQRDYDDVLKAKEALERYREQTTTSEQPFDPANAFSLLRTDADIENLRTNFNRLSLCEQNLSPLSAKCDKLISIILAKVDELKPSIDEITQRSQRGECIGEELSR